MRLIISILILNLLVCSCKNRELSTEHLTKMTVVRQAEKKKQNIQTNAEFPHKTKVSDQLINNTPKGKYHIIVASYQERDKVNAEKMVMRLKKQNHHATLIYSSNRYRVSIANFANENDANNALDKYKDITHRDDIWIYKDK